jgi:hypothetical protein
MVLLSGFESALTAARTHNQAADFGFVSYTKLKKKKKTL